MSDTRRLVFGEDVFCYRCNGKGTFWKEGKLIEEQCRSCDGTGIKSVRPEEPERPTAKQQDRSGP